MPSLRAEAAAPSRPSRAGAPTTLGATLGTALATTNAEITSLQEIDAALQEVDTLINERIDTVAGSAEEVDEFLVNLRDLLIGLKGIPEPAADSAPTDIQPTRTPRPTPTPLAVPTQNP